MSERSFDEQLTKYLTDAHSIEVQAEAQLKAAPKMAGTPDLSGIYERHLAETEEHERLVSERLAQLGAEPSTVKDLAGRAGGWGMVLFAKVNPDTPGKLIAHAFSFEHMELAAYELLRRAAETAGDEATAALARRIGEDERAMADRLAGKWDAAVQASLAEKQADDIRKELVKYLRDAHALEAQAVQLLEAGPKLAEFPELAEVFRVHLDETRRHQQLIEERLDAHDSGPARLQSGALRAGALDLGVFFKGQPDTPVKLSGFAFAFEALELAGYELLRRVATLAGDHETVEVADQIIAEERSAGERVAGTWDSAIAAGLAQQDVGA